MTDFSFLGGVSL